MGKIYLKNSILSILIFSFAFLPYLIPLKSYAEHEGQPHGAYDDEGAYDTTGFSKGVVGYLEDIAPGVVELPLCKAGLNNTLKNLFSKNQQNPDYNEVLANTEISTEGEDLATDDTLLNSDQELSLSADQATIADEAVTTYDPAANQKLDAQEKQLEEILKDTDSLEKNDTCLKSIGRMVIKMLLQKITISTVAWIQNGFDGNPSFIENPGQFFRDIARTNILQFGIEINDPVLFPYGKEFILAQADAYNRSFAQSSEFSLDRLIKETTPQYSAAQFQGDFSSGGWNAWLNMTQDPANNSLGFYLLASNELSNRIEGETQQRKDELQQADGYLGDKRCVDPVGVTIEEHRAALENPVKIREDDGTGLPDEDVDDNSTSGGYTDEGSYTSFPYYDSEGAYSIAGACNRWEFVTPGQMIAQAATTAINYPTNNLLKAEDMNDAVAAIIDALLSQFTSQFIQKGFAGLSNEGSDGGLILNEGVLGDNYVDTQAFSDYGNSHMTNWLRKHHSFNIRTDLTQAFIDVQRTYIEKLELYNLALETLIKYAYQLDYCIPGPTPDWKTRAYTRLAGIERNTPSEGGGIIEIVKGLLAILKAITIHVHPIGIGASLNVGGLAEGLISVLGEGLPEEIMTRYYYASVLRLQAGLRTAPTYQIGSRGDMINIIGHVIEGYDLAIKRTFNRERMPDVTSLATAEYRKVKGYKKIIQNNLTEISVMRSVVARLQVLKEEIDAVPGLPGEDAFEANFDLGSAYNARFARISENLVDGDDVAVIDRLWKSAIDNKKYIHEPIGGQYGRGLIAECMNDLDPGLEEETERITYPPQEFILMEDVPYPGNETADENSNECLPPNVLFQIPAGPNAPPILIGTPCNDSGDPDDPGSCENSYSVPVCGSMSPNGQVCYVYTPPPDNNSNTAEPSELFCYDVDDVVLLSPPNIQPENPLVECEYPEISHPNAANLPESQQCFDPLEDLNSAEFTDFFDTDIGEGEEVNIEGEKEFNNKAKKYVDYIWGKYCNAPAGEDTGNNPYYQFGQQTAGFLQHGYYEEGLINDDPRVPAPDEIASQLVRIPRGVLDVDARCAVLQFGPKAKGSAARTLRAAAKDCKKNFDGPAQDDCKKEAGYDVARMIVAACTTEKAATERICEFKKDGTYRDTIRVFERNLLLY